MSHEEPLTLGTAGHVDHGKTTLVAALTGVDTDRLPEEKTRGLTIVLGYAPLALPGGRQLSLVDVPGHERFVRTMVAGASGIDMYLMAVAADDGVMPQTREHAEVLRALGVQRGVVAITKCDLAEPTRAAREVAELLPGAEIVACSARTGAGIEELRTALARVAAGVHSRAGDERPARLHIDRVFSVRGRGTVVTGTLWSGAISAGQQLELQPGSRPVRVRGVQVHDHALERAQAGQRVAVNLSGPAAAGAVRGEALSARGALAATRVLDCALELRGEMPQHRRVQVHHGTRAVAGRLVGLGEEIWQLRLEAPLLAANGDRLVVRSLAPPDTLGGGVVLDAAARRHGRRQELIARLRAARDGGVGLAPGAALAAPGSRGAQVPARAATERGEADAAQSAPAVIAPARLLATAERLRAAHGGLLSEAELEAERGELAELRAQGSAVRVSGRLYAHSDTLARVRARVLEIIAREGSTTLAAVRDELGLSRKSAQAYLEHLDAARLTRRLPDDSRVAGPRAQARP